MVLSQGIAAPKDSPAPTKGTAPSSDGAGAPDPKAKSAVTEELRESNKSAESSANAFKESAKAARALLEAAKAEEAIIQQAEKAAVEKMEKKAASDKVAADKASKPSGDKAAPQTAAKPEAAPVVKSETPKQEEPPKISKTPESAKGMSAKQPEAAATQPETVAAKPESSSPAPSPNPSVPAVSTAAGAVPQDAAAAAAALTVPAEGEAPKKRKSRFGSSSADLFSDDGKKGKKPKEPAIPLTPEQVKASEIKAFCDKARAAIRKGDDVVAEGFLVSLISVDLPDSEKKGALQEVAGIYEEKGDMTKAIAIYEKLYSVLDKDLDTPTWLLKLGQLYRDAGAYQMAISRYYAVIQLGMKMGTTDFERFQ
ncbi:MAG: hypothetical protein EBR81_06975, partial [Proteobacteria bacterium]|nr:hypothetical protein [Pseudomonadota bacterium]